MCFFKEKKKEKEKQRKFLHESLIPALFVLLWILGLILTIINPDIVSYISPNADQIGLKEKTTLNSLMCIYLVFIIEVGITFKDIQLVMFNKIKHADQVLLKQVNKEFWKIILPVIVPCVIMSFFVLLSYVYLNDYKDYLLSFFVVLLSMIKFFEVWLSNNGEKIFKERNISNVLPKKLN